jgi:hypothetical protein
MRVRKIEEIPHLMNIPWGKKVIAFGEIGVPHFEFYFALIIKEDVLMLRGTQIYGVEYAEGEIKANQLAIIPELNVVTYRDFDGSFMVKAGIPESDRGHEFVLKQPNFGVSTWNKKPIRLHTFRALH